MEERQLINIARPSKTSSSVPPACSAFTLPSNGLLTINASMSLTLESDAVFQPQCTGSSAVILTGSSAADHFQFRDPFYASTIPQCYALAATTVIAYMLVIMLVITPRTFLHEGAVVLGRRGFTNGPAGSDAGIGIGGRPWLQKVAALAVAISLTIATVDTFRVAGAQYEVGYMDAQALQNEVENGKELKIIRVISDTFLWLAQAQTLIRLFPRQREKVIIKWTAFALITMDVLFSILNNFAYSGSSRPRSFVDAVPALAYLFQLALSLLYAAWVIYYSLTKKAFAFYHPQMKNICLVALLSLVSVLVPVVFFVTDISKPDLAGWGDYVRWVGAAAASVVVWEWVERIEALERDDKKDGVLGREVFDGDELLDVSPTSDPVRHSYCSPSKPKSGRRGGTKSRLADESSGISWPTMSGLAHRYRHWTSHDVEAVKSNQEGTNENNYKGASRAAHPPLWPSCPAPALTPISRDGTGSDESTVYTVRNHPISEATSPPIRETSPVGNMPGSRMEILTSRTVHEDTYQSDEQKQAVELTKEEKMQEQLPPPPPPPLPAEHVDVWRTLAKINIFKSRVQGPPLEVSACTVKQENMECSQHTSKRWDFRARLEDFAATQIEKFRDQSPGSSIATEALPRTIIPAPPRRKNLAAALEELEEAERGAVTPQTNSTTWAPLSSSRSQVPLLPVDERENLPPRSYNGPDGNNHGHHYQSATCPPNAATPGWDRNSPMSTLDSQIDRYTPLGSESADSQGQSRSPLPVRRDGLTVVRIPAPHRFPKAPEK